VADVVFSSFYPSIKLTIYIIVTEILLKVALNTITPLTLSIL